MHRILTRILAGQGEPEDLERLEQVASRVMGHTICALGDAASMPVMSFLKHFRGEFEHYVRYGRSPVAGTPERVA